MTEAGPETGGEPLMDTARYHAPSRRVFLDLSNGAIVAFPVTLVDGLEEAADDDLDVVEVVDEGHVLFWPRLGFYLSFLNILTDVLGARTHISRLAGSALTRARDRAERGEAGPPPRRRPRR